MKIDTSIVLMSSDHQLESRHVVSENLDVWVDDPRLSLQEDRITLSKQARALSNSGQSTPVLENAEEAVENDPDLFLIREVIEALTGGRSMSSMLRTLPALQKRLPFRRSRRPGRIRRRGTDGGFAMNTTNPILKKKIPNFRRRHRENRRW